MFRMSLGWVLFVFIADLFSLFVLADAIGAWWSLAWVLGAMMLGVLVILDAGDTLKSLGGIFATPSERVEAIKETPWLLLVGILLFIPGVLSDMVAILLWLPSLRKKLLRKPKPTTANADASSDQQAFEASRPSHSSNTIIEGEWVEKTAPTVHKDPLP
ncbi:MAG: FxsA family protein [Gammaproteobacteria bacterium]|nr:FxsA family protein [Gammaproteobacteria bacterium]